MAAQRGDWEKEKVYRCDVVPEEEIFGSFHSTLHGIHRPGSSVQCLFISWKNFLACNILHVYRISHFPFSGHFFHLWNNQQTVHAIWFRNDNLWNNLRNDAQNKKHIECIRPTGSTRLRTWAPYTVQQYPYCNIPTHGGAGGFNSKSLSANVQRGTHSRRLYTVTITHEKTCYQWKDVLSRTDQEKTRED